jgi:hypothetical protein
MFHPGAGDGSRTFSLARILDAFLKSGHVIGTGATELVHIGQAVIGTNGGLEYFLRTVFNYPTLAECYKVAALNTYNKLCLDTVRTDQ